MKWQSIEAATKNDKPKLLYFPTLFGNPVVSVGYWDDDKSAARPRPHWTAEVEKVSGRREIVKHPPTMFCEIEMPTKGGDS